MVSACPAKHSTIKCCTEIGLSEVMTVQMTPDWAVKTTLTCISSKVGDNLRPCPNVVAALYIFIVCKSTPRKYAFLPCGHHLDFESAVTAQNDEFKSSFHSSYSRLLNVNTQPGKSILSLDTFR